MSHKHSEHADDETLERYAMGQLPDRQAAGLRDHLNRCLACRRRFRETRQYVRAMREAARRLREDENKRES